MRTVSTIASAGLITGALLLSACSTSGSSAGSVPQAASQSRASSSIANKNGIDLRYGGSYQTVQARLSPAKAKADKDVFVSDSGATVFLFKNKTYKPNGSITGFNSNDGIAVDTAGNLYVTNVDSKNVEEFAPGSSTPKCTYDSGLVDPINVTTDAKGDVFVVDFNDLHNPGYIDEFKQCSDTVTTQYSVSSGPEGAVLDSKGDLFVTFFNSGFTGGFEEFVKGKTPGEILSVTVDSPGGLIIDKDGDLIADDQAGSIDVIPEPYTTAIPLVSGLSDPFHAALSKNGKVLFNANFGSDTVTIYKYPAGTLTHTLGSSDGLDGAEGVADSPSSL
jgi:serine/threonine-protein kinase